MTGYEYACPECGARVSSGWADPVCPVCGAPMRVLAEPDPPRSEVEREPVDDELEEDPEEDPYA